MKHESTVKKEYSLTKKIRDAWNIIPPSFPLKNIIGVNPLQGFECFSFEKALNLGNYFFTKKKFTNNINTMNRETIKWCQAFFDEGQSTIKMPLGHLGLYARFKQLAIFDKNISFHKRKFISQLPSDSITAIEICIKELGIDLSDITLFIKNLLATLPGWASYIKYKTEWYSYNQDKDSQIMEYDYVALRFILAISFLKNTHELIDAKNNTLKKGSIKEIEFNEKKYQRSLINKLYYINQNKLPLKNPKAQFIFCIDARSEPFRYAIESEGDYETFGFAGFFGLPICIQPFESEKYDSCPVLLKPTHNVKENIKCDNTRDFHKMKLTQEKIKLAKKIYQSLKYNFTTPFLLAELLGFWSGLWIIMKTFFPKITQRLKSSIEPVFKISPTISDMGILEGISISDQANYAKNLLRTIDLVDHFSPIILLCGHGSKTQNNAYASSLDCGACGGHDGAANARVMATILNTNAVRNHLKKDGILIPDNTKFIAALHNTTTDEVTLFSSEHYPELEKDLSNAQLKNNQKRLKNLIGKNNIEKLSLDWAETRPEWGLAKNAAFIVGPRNKTKNIDLEGRCFLHSYNWKTDNKLETLSTILMAPMIVAQWINCQYFFSTIDPVSYGSGSKITQNITGKIGVMQGNASDLMHGLPLQSTHQSNKDPYHELMRLMTIIYAPRESIITLILKNNLLKKLTKNAWVKFCCIDPTDEKIYILNTDLEWKNHEHL